MNKRKKTDIIAASVIGAVLLALSFGMIYPSTGLSWKWVGDSLIVFVLLAVVGATSVLIGLSIKKSLTKKPADNNKKVPEPFGIDYKLAQKKIAAVEKDLGLITTNKFVGFILRGAKGTSNVIPCVGAMYFLADRIYVVHRFKNNTYTLQIPYRDVLFANVIDGRRFYVIGPEQSVFTMWVRTEDDGKRLKHFLVEIGFFKRRCLETLGKLFLTLEDTNFENDDFAQLRFCDDTQPSDEEVDTSYHAENSLYVCEEDFMTFLKEYGDLFDVDGSKKDELFRKVVCFSSDDARTIIERIRTCKSVGDNPTDCETLLFWLEIAESEHNGFYFI